MKTLKQKAILYIAGISGEQIYAEGIEPEEEEIRMTEGDQRPCSFNAVPAPSKFTGFEYESEDESIVTVDEFGALKKTDGDLQARVNFAAYYTAMASTRGIPVVWWDNAAFSGGGEKFGLIDRKKVEWRYPDIALAIITNCRVNR